MNRDTLVSAVGGIGLGFWPGRRAGSASGAGRRLRGRTGRRVGGRLALALGCAAWVAAAAADPAGAAGTNEPVGGSTNDVEDTYWGWSGLVDPSRGNAAYGGVVESLLWCRVVWSRDVALLMRKTASELAAKDASPMREVNRELSVRSDPWGEMVWIGLSNDVQRVDRISRAVTMLKPRDVSERLACPQQMSDVVGLLNQFLDEDRKAGEKGMAVERVLLEKGYGWVTPCLARDRPLVQMLWTDLVVSDADVRMDGKTLVIFKGGARQKAPGADASRTSVTLEEVAALPDHPPEEAGRVAVGWVEGSDFPTNFEWQAAMLFLRQLPDAVPKGTLKAALNRIESEHGVGFRRGSVPCPRFNYHFEGVHPFRSLVTVAKIRLKHDSISNAIEEMVSTCSTSRIAPRGVCVDAFMQTEVVYTMLQHNYQVPERFRSSPEYVRHEVLREAANMTAREIMEKGSAAIWVPRRKPVPPDTPDDERDDVNKDIVRKLCRAVFASVAWQSVLLQESKRLADEGRRFIESHGQAKGGEEGMGEAVQMVWAYLIASRHLSQEDGTALLARVEQSVGKDRALEILKTYDGARDSTAEGWWCRRCVYPSARDAAYHLIFEYVYYDPPVGARGLGH